MIFARYAPHLNLPAGLRTLAAVEAGLSPAGNLSGVAQGRNFFAELGRRHVWRAAVLYAGAVWALSQGVAQLTPALNRRTTPRAGS